MTIYQLGNKKIQRHVETWIANNAIVIGDITLKENSSVWFGAVLRGDIENIEVGDGSNIQDNCVLHTDAGFPSNHRQRSNCWTLSYASWMLDW